MAISHRGKLLQNSLLARLHILEGLLVAYLNIDEVIEIIRTEDEPKPVMMAEFELTDRQAEAILNMRLRSLRRLEEIELINERDALTAEREGLAALLASDALQWKRIGSELEETRKKFGKDTPFGARRTLFADMGDVEIGRASCRERVSSPV